MQNTPTVMVVDDYEDVRVILKDLALPEIDGFAAALRIRSHPDLSNVPIIAISAYGELGIDAQLKIDPASVGFNAYLPKPFVPEKLLSLVGQYLPKGGGADG